MKKFFQLFSSALLISTFTMGCSSKTVAEPAKPVLPESIEAAVGSLYRTPENKVRDQYRHPVETLKFFGLQPGMTVIEISPGAGWYMEILAPYLTAKGQYIAAIPPSSPDNAAVTDMNRKTATWLEKHPEVAAKAKTVSFNPPDPLELAPEGTADMVLTFRNVHNWMAKGTEREVFKAFFKALKAGGVLGVTEHRANPKMKRDPKAKSGYVLEKDVIRLAESVGFKLDSRSEINANPKDTKDYAEGVWTLPPTLKLKEKDRDKYIAIGESDRMTLKFRKP